MATEVRKQMRPMQDTGSLIARFKPETGDDDNLTFHIIWSTGAEGRRYSMQYGEVMESLALDRVTLDRLNNGAPVVDSHNINSVRNQIGDVLKAWVEDGDGHAIIRFSERARDLYDDVKKGIIKKISIGLST